MENMSIYNSVRKVPDEAKKPISAGRLKGMTDINPMWRIQMLTEVFGMCGFGWYYKVTDQRVVEVGDERCAFVDIDLFVKADGDWSMPIHGNGGAKLSTQERNGLYVSDECFKMATTDAISVACKQLGFGADVYWASGRSKYTANVEKVEEEKAPVYEEKLQEAEAKARVLGYINRHNYSKEQIEQICKLYKIEKLQDMTIQHCEHYIKFIEKKGGNIDE